MDEPDRSLAAGLIGYRANTLVDADGRPLGEVSSPLYDPVETELVACPYPDGRRGRPMNRTALRQVSPVWPEVLATVRALAGPEPTVHRAWQIALVGISAPLLVEGPVPVVLSALYKASLGLSQITTSLLLGDDGVADAPFASLGAGGDFFAALDRGQWLVGQVQVCAGTRVMLEQLGDALGGARGESRVSPVLAASRSAGSPGSVAGARSPLGTAEQAADRLAEVAARTVGLHAAHVLLVESLRRRGFAVPPDPLPPWLRALTAVPDRPLAHVRRLYPAGACPPEVERVLAAPPETPEALDAWWADVSQELRPPAANRSLGDV